MNETGNPSHIRFKTDVTKIGGSIIITYIVLSDLFKNGSDQYFKILLHQINLTGSCTVTVKMYSLYSTTVQ